jgi:hypothetical protein
MIFTLNMPCDLDVEGKVRLNLCNDMAVMHYEVTGVDKLSKMSQRVVTKIFENQK